MYNFREMMKDVYWVGGSDKRLSRFENLFPLPSGVAYNAYLIVDEKTAVFDTVDASISTLFVNNVKKILDGRDLDYIVINHLEPDHSAALAELLVNYPKATIVTNQTAVRILEQFYGKQFSNIMIIKECDKLELGQHTIEFMFTPMAHWPESMMSYETSKGILFSSDAFGSFGAVDGKLFDYEVGLENIDFSEARRYYSNILGKYGDRVQNALRKASAKKINLLCPVHGIVFKDHIDKILEKYILWSNYESEQKGVTIAYASMYGNTKDAAFMLANELAKNGVKNIDIFDVSETDISFVISSIYKNSHFVLMSVTYNMEIYPKMQQLLDDMKALTIRSKKAAVIGNGSWAPIATKKMSEHLCQLKDVVEIFEPITIKSALNDVTAMQVEELAKRFSEDILS